MDKDRKIAIAVGVLFIIATLAPILTAPFIGFLGGGVVGEPIPDYLATAAAEHLRTEGAI